MRCVHRFRACPDGHPGMTILMRPDLFTRSKMVDEGTARAWLAARQQAEAMALKLRAAAID